jgi:DDE superfamily endonuclease
MACLSASPSSSLSPSHVDEELHAVNNSAAGGCRGRSARRAGIARRRDRMRDAAAAADEALFHLVGVLALGPVAAEAGTAQPAPRTRVDKALDAHAECLRFVQQIDDAAFKAEYRMSRSCAQELLDILAPAFNVPTSRRGPKRMAFEVAVLYTLRVLAQNTRAWGSLCRDWSVGRRTLQYKWLPEVCLAILARLPLPGLPRADDMDAWRTIADSFASVAAHAIQRDAHHRSRFRRRLPGESSFRMFGRVGLVIDGVTTRLDLMPVGATGNFDSQDFYSVKDGTYALLHLVGVDGTGRVLWASCGFLGSMGDIEVLNTTNLYRAMSGEEDWPLDRLPDGFVVIADSGFILRPWMIIPYSARELSPRLTHARRAAFNFRLSQIRVVSEQCFGQLKTR